MKHPTCKTFTHACIRVLTALLVLLAGLLPAATVTAQDPAPEPGPSFLLILTVPNDLPVDRIPAGLDPLEAGRAAAEIVFEDAAPLAQALGELQGAGIIQRYEPVENYAPPAESDMPEGGSPGVFAYRVFGSPEMVNSAGLPMEAGSLIAATVLEGQPVPECPALAAYAFHERVFVHLQSLQWSSPASSSTETRAGGEAANLDEAEKTPEEQEILNLNDPQALAEPSPWIAINHSLSGNFTSVSGIVPPSRTVIVEVVRNGKVIVSERTFSDTAGYYSVSPYFMNCPGNAYSWEILDGDVVRVSAAGKTYTAVAARVTAWIDPNSNQLVASTLPGRTVVAWVTQDSADGCSPGTGQVRSGKTDASGQARIALSDVNASASARVVVGGTSGNGSYTYARAFQFYLNDASKSAMGYARPLQLTTLLVKRGPETLTTLTYGADQNGVFRFSIPISLSANDVIEVYQAGSLITRYVYVATTAQLDAATNRVTGTAPASRKIAIKMGGNRCANRCFTAISGSDGKFSITVPYDILNLDTVSVFFYDSNGNYQWIELPGALPSVQMDMRDNIIHGKWHTPNTYLTMTIRSKSGAVKDSYAKSSDIYGSFIWVNHVALAAGDSVVITDTVKTITAAVPDFSARMRLGTSALTGRAPAGHMVVNYYGSEISSHVCRESVISGDFNLTFENGPFKAYDYANIDFYDPSGYKFTFYAFTFSFEFQKGAYLSRYASTHAKGRVETPGATVTVTHRRGGAVLGTYANLPSDAKHEFSLTLPPGKAFEEGDKIAIQTSDGTSKEVVVPPLEAEFSQNGQVIGRAPAGARITGNMYHFIRRPTDERHIDDIPFSTRSDASGAFTFDLPQISWCHSGAVSIPVSAASPCNSLELSYRTAENFLIHWASRKPTPIAADAFEPDNAIAQAKPSVGQATHSFHDSTDRDFIRIEVSADLVGKPFGAFFSGLDEGMRLWTVIYNSSGSPLIEMQDIHEGLTTLTYTFTAPGMYYLALLPFADEYGKCNSRYTVNAYFYDPLYLPEVKK